MSESFTPFRHHEIPTEHSLLREATPSLLEKNKNEWIQMFEKRLQQRFSSKDVQKGKLEEASHTIATLVPHHTTTLSHFKKAVQNGFLRSAADLKTTEDGADMVRNTYDFDRRHGLDQYVFLRLGGKPFQMHKTEDMISLEFSADILDESDVLVSFQDFVFAAEAQKYDPSINAWSMYLKETFKGGDYKKVLSYLIASEFENAASFLESPKVSREFADIPAVRFITSSNIQSEIKIPHALDVQKIQHIKILSGATNLLSSIKELGYEDSKISVV